MKTLFALACCLCVWSQVAFGHAALVATSPAAGAVLARAPQEISLRFDGPVQTTSVRLFDPKGRQLGLDAQADGRDGVLLKLPAGTANDAGTYLLSWRVLSQDGRPVGGQLEYSIRTLSPPPVAALAHTSLVRDAAIWLTRWLTYLCLFAVGGAALFRLRFRDSELRWARLPVFLGLALLLVDLALQGLDLLDVPWTALLGAAPWKTALASAHAQVLGLMALGLLAGFAAFKATRSGWLWGWAVASALLPGAALAMGGQMAGAPAWVARPLVAVHVLLAMAWVGTLIPLYRLLRERTPSPVGGGRRHTGQGGGAPSPFAWVLFVALPLLLSGVALAILQLDRVADLWRTDYGSIVLATLVVAAVLSFVALRNRWRLAGPAAKDSSQARSRARHGLGTELILAVGLLSVVSLWRFAPPPRNHVAASAPHGPVIDLEDRTVRALIELPPQGAAGPWRIQPISIDGLPLEPQRVTLTLGNPQAGLDPIQYAAQRQPDGRWRVDPPALAVGGQWHIQVDVWVGDFRQITLQGDLTLPKPQAPAVAAGHPAKQ